jgi:transmembrane sensor
VVRDIDERGNQSSYMDSSILQKYFEGGCDPEEAALVKQWLEQHPEEAFRYMEAAWEEQPAAPMPTDMEQRLRSHLPLRKSRRIPVAAWWSAAAAVLVIAGGLWFTQQNRQSSNNSSILAIFTPGKHTLPDGTDIWLKENSGIRIDTAVYGKTSRHIELEKGEVFFEVKTNANAPFEVVAGNTLTKVLGTSFSIATGKAIKVAVATGKVSVAADGKGAVALLPGHAISVTDKGDTTMSAEPSWLPGLWKANELQLTDASFEELRLALKGFYGVHVHTGSDHVKKQLYNIKIERTTSAANVIQVLSLLNGIHYQRQNDSTYLIN